MSTYLELCQDAARESSTVSGVQPTSVTGQVQRLAKFVAWVNTAWLKIQNSRDNWLWMLDEFEADLSVSTGRYTATALGVSRWAQWVTRPDSLTIYKVSEGVSDEGPLIFMPWREFRATYERGSQTDNRPVHFSVSPAGELCFGPKPDVAYTCRGEFRKSPQTLSANADVPECPAQYHLAISDYANILMAQNDEAEMHIVTNQQRYAETRFAMERDQLPRLEIGWDPIA